MKELEENQECAMHCIDKNGVRHPVLNKSTGLPITWEDLEYDLDCHNESCCHDDAPEKNLPDSNA
jgi:hypothetical protein